MSMIIQPSHVTLNITMFKRRGQSWTNNIMTIDFGARVCFIHVFGTALSKYEAHGEHLTAAHQHSHIVLCIHNYRNRRLGHFARMVPRGLGNRGDGYGDTVESFLERTHNATLDMASEILGLPAASLPRNARSEISLPIRFGGMGVGAWLPWRMRPTSERPVWERAPPSVFLERKMPVRAGKICPRWCSDGRLATAVITTLFRRFNAPDGDGGDNEHMYIVVKARFGMGRLGCHVRCSCSPRVRTPHNHILSVDSSKTSDDGWLALAPSPKPDEQETSTLLGPLMTYPRSYHFLLLPRISFQSYKPTSASPSTCFASPFSLPRFLTSLDRSLGVLHLVSTTAPFHFLLWTRLQRAAWATSVTSSRSTMTPTSVSRIVASLDYYHPASSPLFTPHYLRFQPSMGSSYICGVHLSRRW
jgi:hypothetical protein